MSNFHPKHDGLSDRFLYTLLKKIEQSDDIDGANLVVDINNTSISICAGGLGGEVILTRCDTNETIELTEINAHMVCNAINHRSEQLKALKFTAVNSFNALV